MESLSPKRCRCRSRMFSYGLISVVFLSCLSSANAQVSLIPQLQEVSVNRGGKAGFDLQIANRGSESLTFTMVAYGLEVAANGIPSPTNSETEHSCAGWITFTPVTFELAPEEVQIVDGLITAPQEAIGGYSAFITAQFNVPLPPVALGEDEGSRAEIAMAQAVSSVLLVTTRSSRNFVALEPDSLILVSGRRSSTSRVPSFSGSLDDVWQACLMVKNSGNIHTVATGEISIWREDASLVERADLTAGRGFVLPGAERLFTANGTRSLEDGVYMARVRILSKKGRSVQGVFPYSIVAGDAIPGAASDRIRALLKATAPSFSLSKRMLDYRITPKGKRTQGVALKNHGSDSLTVVPRAVDWTLDETGTLVLRPEPGDQVRSCTSWLSVSPSPIVIPPSRSRSVKVTVTAPSELQGEYYSALVFETPESQEPLPTEFELPRTLLMTVSASQGLEYGAEIQSFRREPVSPLMRVFVVDVLNTGNTHCFASGKLEIYDLKYHLVMDPIPFGGRNDYILPNRVRGYAVPCPGALDPGTYEAVVAVDYLDGAQSVISKIRFEEHHR